MAEFEGIYRSGVSPKRRGEVLERLRAGIGEKQIAADLGIARHSLTEIIEGLREEGFGADEDRQRGPEGP